VTFRIVEIGSVDQGVILMECHRDYGAGGGAHGIRALDTTPGLYEAEEFLLRRLRRTRKLFAFLRDHRHELFDDGFQAELEAMYRDTGAAGSQYRLPCSR